MFTRMKLLIVALGVAACTALGLAPQAQAAMVWPSHSSYTHNYHYSYSELRSAIYPNGLVIGNLYNETTVYMRCWTDSTWYYGNYNTNRWFYVTLSNGRSGWVTSSFVYNQASVPRC